MRRLIVDLVLTEPRYYQTNVKDSEILGDGPWTDLIEICYESK